MDGNICGVVVLMSHHTRQYWDLPWLRTPVHPCTHTPCTSWARKDGASIQPGTGARGLLGKAGEGAGGGRRAFALEGGGVGACC